MKTFVKKFDSVAALSSYLSTTPPAGMFADYDQDSRAPWCGSEKFAGTKDFDQANNYLLSGWSEGAAAVRAEMVKAPTKSTPRPRNYNSVVGFAPNVPAYIQGSPLNMINRKTVNTPSKVVTIAYNCSVSYNVEAADLQRAAAKLFNAVASLELSGVRVELYVILSAKKGNEWVTISTKIKLANQPFNLLKMVYPVVHPSFLRRHLLGVIECLGVGDQWYCYGAPQDTLEDTIKAVKALSLPKNTIPLTYEECNKRSEKDLLTYICK